MADTYTNQPYTRNMGFASGLGQTQQQNCPTGYQWNATQGRCIASQSQNYTNQLQTNNQQMQQNTQLGQTTQTKPGQSDYAKLLAQAIDINPQMPGVQSPQQGQMDLQQYNGGAFQSALSTPEATRFFPNNDTREDQKPPPETRDNQIPQPAGSGGCVAKANATGTWNQSVYNSCMAEVASGNQNPEDRENVDKQCGTCAQLQQSGNCGSVYTREHSVRTPCTGPAGPAGNCADAFIWCGEESATDFSNEKAACEARVDPISGKPWIWVSNATALNPTKGTCMPPSGAAIDPATEFDEAGNIIGDIPQTVDPESLQVEGNPIDFASILNSGDYAGIKALTGGIFNGQTLDELEQGRLDAAQADYDRMYGKSADDLTNRINRETQGAGMFHSGVRADAGQGTGMIPKYLGELESEKNTKLGVAQAEIRGERPELELREHEAMLKAWDTWAGYDLQTKESLVKSMLQGNEQEYLRQFNNGTLTLDAFKGNVEYMRLYLDFLLSAARTDMEQEETTAKIAAILNNMTDEERLGILQVFS